MSEKDWLTKAEDTVFGVFILLWMAIMLGAILVMAVVRAWGIFRP